MQVTLRTRYASADGNHAPGATIEVTDAIGAQLVDGGYGEVTDAPEEVAVAPEAETAAKRPRRARH